MDDVRKKRYVEKIKHVEKRIGELEVWKEDFFYEEKTRLACYKAMQEIIEGCMDLVSMILKDEKELPKDDYSNIDVIEKKGMIDNKIANALRELNGLRNRIVHEYNGLDDEIALTSMEELIPKIKEFLTVVKEWLKKKI
jgi:uncharacterized protein YutE (UPF0331/DUF86 family)